MNVQRARPPIKKSQLENEVILAVVVLYALLSATMLAIHYSQRSDPETQTVSSSTSPAHSRNDENVSTDADRCASPEPRSTP